MENYIEAIEHLLALAKAEKAGATIQYRTNAGYPWKDLTKTLDQIPTHVLDDHGQYRIKPEPTLRPWTCDEVPVGKILVHKQDRSWKRIIVACSSEGLWGGTSTGLISFYEALEQYTLADGSPCGTEEAQ